MEMNDMKQSLLLAVALPGLLSACAGGSPTPTAPSERSDTTQTTSAVQNVPAVTLTFLPPAVANQATTIKASASPSDAIAKCTLDLGDGSAVVAFSLGDIATLKHIFAAAGTFIVTLTCTNPDGATASVSVALVVH